MTLQSQERGPASRPFSDRYATLEPRAMKGVLASLALVMLTASLDSTAVGTALPRIVSDLRGNDLYAWVFTAYLLAMTATMPLWGSLSDRFGRRPVLFIGLAVFLVGSALCGVSQGDVAARGLPWHPGPGGGCHRARLAGRHRRPLPAGRPRSAAGRLQLALRAGLPHRADHRRDPGGHRGLALGLLRQPARRPRRSGGHVAVHAAVAAGCGADVIRRGRHGPLRAAVVPFLLGIRNLPTGSLADPDVGGLMLLGLLVGVAFMWVETRAAMPIIPVRLFRDATFAVACGVVFLAVAGLFVAIVFLPRYFQLVHGASATESGWQIMTLLLGLIVGAVGAGQVVARTGRWKVLLLVAMAIGVAGMALLSQLTADAPMPLVWGAMFLTGLGLGPISSVLTAVVQTTVPPAVMGTATSTLTFFRQLGASIWLAVGGSLFSASFRSELPVRLRAGGVPADLVAGLTGGPGAVASEESTSVGDLGTSILAALPPEARAVVEPFIDAIVTGMHEAFSLATGDAFLLGISAVIVAFLMLLPLREQRLPLERLAEIRGRTAEARASSTEQVGGSLA